MVNALHAASTGMEAQMEQIENISNNIANVNTTGYKKSRAEFQDLLYETLEEPGAKTSAVTQSPVGIQRGMGVTITGTQRDFSVGSPRQTNRNLDLMIAGDGFFQVRMPDGTMGYRRDGTFYRGTTGRVETAQGYPLVPEITIPPDSLGISISQDGIVSSQLPRGERQQIGQIQLATFVNRGGLKAVGQNIFVESEASGASSVELPMENITGGLRQGYLETSNVDIVREMTEMISAQRAFEMNSKVIQSVDQVLQNTVNIR